MPLYLTLPITYRYGSLDTVSCHWSVACLCKVSAAVLYLFFVGHRLPRSTNSINCLQACPIAAMSVCGGTQCKRTVFGNNHHFTTGTDLPISDVKRSTITLARQKYWKCALVRYFLLASSSFVLIYCVCALSVSSRIIPRCWHWHMQTTVSNFNRSMTDLANSNDHLSSFSFFILNLFVSRI